MPGNLFKKAALLISMIGLVSMFDVDASTPIHWSADQVSALAESLRKQESFPTKIDNETTLTNITSEGLTLIYWYKTTVDLPPNMPIVQNMLKTADKNVICRDPDFVELFNVNGVMLRRVYQTPKDVKIIVNLGKGDCRTIDKANQKSVQLSRPYDGPPRMYLEKSGIQKSIYTNLPSLMEWTIWDDYGMKIVKYEMMGEGSGNKNIVLLRRQNGVVEPQTVLQVSLSDGSYKKTPYKAGEIIRRLDGDAQGFMAEQLMLRSGFWERSNETKQVEGRTCHVWRSIVSEGLTQCTWQGLILETANASGLYKTTIGLELKSVNPRYFDVPGLLRP